MPRCQQCNSEVGSAQYCTNCGRPAQQAQGNFHNVNMASPPNQQYPPNNGFYQQASPSMNTQNNRAVCPRCGGTNISFQREESVNLGGSRHTFSGSSSRGCLYWLFIGWWIWMFKAILAVCTLGLSLLFTRKRNRVKGHGINANKTFYKTIGICQNCGNTWKAN